LFSGIMAGAAHAQVSPVAIKTGAEMGSGYAIRKGNECIVITAAHVVKEAEFGTAISLFDDTGAGAPGAKIVFSDAATDLAVLRVTAPQAFNCQSSWQDGATVQAALRNASQGAVKMQVLTLREGGLSDIIPVSFAGNSGPQKFRVRSTGDTIAQGQSGSALVSDGKLLGIVQTTADGVTTILRQDQIHLLAKSFAQQEGTRVLLTPIIYQNAAVDVANAAARQYMEQQQKIVPKDAPREWIDATGGLSQTGDAQYIFRGKVLVAQTEQVASTVTQANAAGNLASGFGGNLGQVGSLLSRGSQAANQMGAKATNTKVTLQVELSLTNISSGKTTTELVNHVGQFPTAGDSSAGMATEIQKSVVEGLPALFKKAGVS
jgi:Trypsin-like peptidase domain